MINVKTQDGNYVVKCNIIYIDGCSNIAGVADNNDIYLLGYYEDENYKLEVFQKMIRRINSNILGVFEMPPSIEGK